MQLTICDRCNRTDKDEKLVWTTMQLWTWDGSAVESEPAADPPAPDIQVEVCPACRDAILEAFRRRKMLSTPGTRRRGTPAEDAEMGSGPTYKPAPAEDVTR